MEKKKSYQVVFLTLLNKIEYLTSQEHRNKIKEMYEYPDAYILGEIIASAKWEQYEVTKDINILNYKNH